MSSLIIAVVVSLLLTQFSVTLLATLAVIGGLITFLAMQHKILDKLEPMSDWLRE